MSIHTLMFGWEYPPVHCGGLGVASQGIVRGLLHHGAQVTLVLPHDAAEENGVTILSPGSLGGETVIQVPSKIRAYDSFETYALRIRSAEGTEPVEQLYGSNLGEEVERYTAVAAELTKNLRPDVVHTHDWMTLEAGARAAQHHQRPLVAHVHATELDRTEFHPNPWILRREIDGLMRADHILAVSGYTKDLLVREYGISGDKISVLHNGTFHARPFPRPAQDNVQHPLVLFLGRLTVQKGVSYFIRAAKRVLETKPDVRFVVAGEGYLLPQLIEETLKLGLQDSIIFAGRVTSDEAKKLYARAECFVMPSVSEPFGLVALEAITHGAPVVLSRQSGVAEVLPSALLVDFWDTDKMADCILTVLREPALRDTLRSQSGRILRNLTWNRQAGKIMSVYEKLRIMN
jgi:glycosyltransferase involved in cell wall biosynthesis